MKRCYFFTRCTYSIVHHVKETNTFFPSAQGNTDQLLAGPAEPHLVLGVELVAVLLQVLLHLLQLILAQEGGRPRPPDELQKTVPVL